MSKSKSAVAQLLVCVENKGYDVSLEKRKIYLSLRDTMAARHDQVRVIDESGEDYLFPEEFFRPIDLPQDVQAALRQSS